PPAIADALPSFRERAPEARPMERPPEIDWLRERQFAREIGGESSGAWKVVVVLGLLLVVGALAYFRLEILGPLRSALSPGAPPATAPGSTGQSASANQQTASPEPIPEEPVAAQSEPATKPVEKRATEAAPTPSRAKAPAVSQNAAPGAGKIQNT